MKRTVIFTVVLILLISCICGCTSKKQTQSGTTTTTVNKTSSEDLLNADKALSFTKEEETLKIKVTLPECGGKEVSLILITDPEYQYNWEEDPSSRLIDMGQIKLDNNGEGSIELRLKSGSEKCYLCLTAPSGNCIAEVK